MEQTVSHICAEAVREQLQGVRGIDEALQSGELVESLAFGAADDGHDAGEEDDVLRAAAVLRQAGLEERALEARFLHVLHDGENDIGRAGGELLARLGPAGLEDNGTPLRAAADIERALDLEVGAASWLMARTLVASM